MKTHLTAEEAKTVLEALKIANDRAKEWLAHEQFFDTSGSYKQAKEEADAIATSIRIMEAEDVKGGELPPLPTFPEADHVIVNGWDVVQFWSAKTITALMRDYARAALSAPAAPSEQANRALRCARVGLKTAEYVIKGREHTGFIDTAVAIIDAALSAAAPAAVEGELPPLPSPSDDAIKVLAQAYTGDDMQAYARAAVAAEREACAAECQSKHANGNWKYDHRDECAEAIRNRNRK